MDNMDAISQFFDSLGTLDIDSIRRGLITLAVFVGVFAVLFVVMYVFRTIGLYSLAKNLSLKKPVRCYYPILEYYMMGSVADTAMADKKNSRTTITVMKSLEIGCLALELLCVLGIVRLLPDLIDTLMGIMEGNVTSFDLDSLLTGSTMSLISLSVLASLLQGASGIFRLAFRISYTIVSYRIYVAYGVKAATFWAVASFLIPPVGHVLLFVIRRRKPVKEQNV